MRLNKQVGKNQIVKLFAVLQVFKRIGNLITQVLVGNFIMDTDDDLDQLMRQWQNAFDGQILTCEVEGLENQLLFGFNGEFVYQSLTERMIKADALSAQHGFSHLSCLAALFASNPIGQGIL